MATSKKKTAKKTATKKEETIKQLPASFGVMDFVLVGTSPIVVHAFSEKSKRQMRQKQQKRAKGAREAKDPQADFNGARYRMDLDGQQVDAFPSLAVKKSLVSACRMVEGVSMTLMRQVVHVNQGQEFRPLMSGPGEYYSDDNLPRLREDIVRVGGKGPGTGTADLRYRPEYFPWYMPIRVKFLENAITAEQVYNLLVNAGFGCGLGENRPEKTGADWGTFTPMTAEEFEAQFREAAE